MQVPAHYASPEAHVAEVPFVGIAQHVRKEVVDFGIADKKGRALGIYICASDVTVRASVPADATKGTWDRAGTPMYSIPHTDTVEPLRQHGAEIRRAQPFALYMQTTRNGVGFGASQNSMYFATAAERDVYITKRIADTKKRAAKVAAKDAA